MKYVLIGCGRIAVNHIKAVLNNHLELAAVCDVKPEAMETLLRRRASTLWTRSMRRRGPCWSPSLDRSTAP